MCTALVAIAGVPAMLAGQELSTAFGHYRVDVWRAQNGVRLAFTSNLVETRDGYLWLSSQSGLTRFDGFRFTKFDGNNLPLLRGHPDLETYPVLEDSTGTLWIGVDEGVLAYVDGQLRPIDVDSAFLTDQVNAAAVDHSGTVWVVTRSGRVIRIPRRGSPRQVLASSGSYSGSGITIDALGDIWVAVGSGEVYRAHHDSLSTVTFPAHARVEDVRHIYATADSSVWLGMPNAIVQWRHGQFRRIPFPPGQALDAVSCFAVGPDGALWIGTQGAGLYRYDGQRFAAFKRRDGLSDDRVVDILVDRSRNVWVATRDGLNRFRPVPFDVLTAKNGLPSELPGAMVQDSAGAIWLAPPTGGLFRTRITNDHATFDQIQPISHADRVNVIARGRGNTMWAGMLGGSVSRFGGSSVHLDHLPPVTAISEDADGTVWIGTWNGLVQWRHGRRRVLTTADGLPDNAVQRLYRDSRGTLWVATQSGLARSTLDGRFAVQAMPPNGASRALVFFEAGGSLWLGTAEGLAKVGGEPSILVNTSRGLPENWVGAGEADDAGNLWLGQLGGLTRVSIADLTAVASGRQPSLTTATTFEALDGLPGGDPSGWSHPWSFRDSKGTIWFAMGHGLIAVDPSHIEQQVTPPVMHIEELDLDGTPMTARPTVTLGPDVHRLEIRFTGVDLANGPLVRFRYRLDGFDTGWTNPTGQRVAAYTGLAPGRYRFRVAGRGAGGPWSPTEAAVDIVVLPPFYRRAWFIVATGALILSLLWSGHRALLLARSDAVRAERSRLAREIHDSLLQGFSTIALQLHVASARLALPPSQQPLLDRALSLADRTLRHAREVVSDIRVPGLATADLSTECEDAAQRILADTGTVARVTVRGRVRRLAQVRHTESLRIVEEALTNVRTHAAATQVAINLDYQWRRLRLTVTDNGRGFDMDRDGRQAGHWGLLGMRERASRIAATLSVDSTCGVGTVVRLDIPYR